MTTILQESDNRGLKLTYTLLGLISGFPLVFSGSLLQMWLTEYGVSLETLGWVTMLSIPYGLKFLWTPLLESYFLGSCPYRFWMKFSSLSMAILLMVLSILNPSQHLLAIIALTFFFSWSSATFDAVLDGYRLTTVAEDKMGLTISCYVLGYRIGLLLAGGIGSVIADPQNFGFNTFYCFSFLVMLAGFLFTTTLKSPKSHEKVIEQDKKGFLSEIKESFFEIKRVPGILILIGIIMSYRFCDNLLAALSSNYFQKECGYSLTTLGFAYKISGLVATLAGSFIGGLWVDKTGVFKLLGKICLIQGLANFSYLYLFYSQRTLTDLFIVVWIEHFCSGLANAACVVLLSYIATKIVHNKATAYALLSALYIPARLVSGRLAAYCINAYGWPIFIVLSASVIILPLALIGLYHYQRGIAQRNLDTHLWQGS